MSDSTFVPVAHNIIRSGLLAELSPPEFVVWVVLRAHCGRTNEAWPRQATIARLAGLGTTAVKKAIRSLIDRGFVVAESHGRSNCYTVRPLDSSGLGRNTSPDRDARRPVPDAYMDVKRPVMGRVPTQSSDDRDTMRPGMGRQTSPERDAKRPAEEEPPKKNQEPPQGAGDSWNLVGSRLQQLGLTAWRSTVSQARCSGLSPSQALEVIAAYDPARWSAGALAWRLRNGSPDMAASDGWPTPRESDRPRPKRFPQFEVWRATQIKRLGPGVTIDDELEQRLQAAYDLARSHYLTPTTG